MRLETVFPEDAVLSFQFGEDELPDDVARARCMDLTRKGRWLSETERTLFP